MLHKTQHIQTQGLWRNRLLDKILRYIFHRKFIPWLIQPLFHFMPYNIFWSYVITLKVICHRNSYEISFNWYWNVKFVAVWIYKHRKFWHYIEIPRVQLKTYWSLIGVKIGGSSVNTGSKFWSSLSSSNGGLNGGVTCFFSN